MAKMAGEIARSLNQQQQQQQRDHAGVVGVGVGAGAVGPVPGGFWQTAEAGDELPPPAYEVQ